MVNIRNQNEILREERTHGFNQREVIINNALLLPVTHCLLYVTLCQAFDSVI
jgi:hypothetical protein